MNDTEHHREQFLAAMRNIANSVTIVTTNGPAGTSGATVSSFCSVSADPPTVLVCLNRDSRTAQFIEQNNVFAVNVLPDNQEKLAKIFAGLADTLEEDRFQHGEWIDGHDHLPMLKGATDFTCKVVEKVTATSHHIFIGEVTGINIGADSPLLYMDQKFLQVISPSR